MKKIDNKLQKLKAILKSYPGVVIAFSGGVDSTFLLAVARRVLAERVIAVTVSSPLYPAAETRQACQLARKLGVRHKIIAGHEIRLPSFSANPRHRCYFCKHELFSRLIKIAAPHGYVVLDGSNRSDRVDFRPGRQAARELEIVSPLELCGLEKEEIRKLSRRLGLPNWNKPAMACLASRVPYGQRIDRSTLQRIAAAESYLKRFVPQPCRVRDYFPLARIEVAEAKLPKILKARRRIVSYFQRLGYQYVTLDLAGFRSGSMNL